LNAPEPGFCFNCPGKPFGMPFQLADWDIQHGHLHPAGDIDTNRIWNDRVLGDCPTSAITVAAEKRGRPFPSAPSMQLLSKGNGSLKIHQSSPSSASSS
jgi:hypothetical protein